MLKNIIKDKIINVEKSAIINSCTGVIVSVDNIKGIADVKVNNQFGTGTFIVKMAKILSPSGSSILQSYSIGDKVCLTFDGNSYVGAKITGSSIDSVKSSHVLSNATKDIEDKFTYKKDILDIVGKKYGTFELVDINATVKKLIEDSNGFSNGDIGISSPKHDSIIKINDYGDIIISSGIGASIILKKDGTAEIEAKKIIYK